MDEAIEKAIDESNEPIDRAQEIRRWSNKGGRVANYTFTDNAAFVMLLTEIAAQLADMNDNLYELIKATQG